MIAFFVTIATDFQAVCGAAEATVAGVWGFFAVLPSAIVSVF
jgi:hypothetical protein